MKRLLLLSALVASTVAQAETIDTLRLYSLQGVQVVSTRASRNTPVAYTNVDAAQL